MFNKLNYNNNHRSIQRETRMTYFNTPLMIVIETLMKVDDDYNYNYMKLKKITAVT